MLVTIHARAFLSPATLGALYRTRNPLDVAPSAANHWHCSLDQAVENLCRPGLALCKTRKALPDQVRQCLGSWSEHVLSWVDAPGLKVEVVRYEDLLASPQETFTRAARFLQLPDDSARVAKAIRFSDFRELARQEAEKGFRERPRHAYSFFRQGQSGEGRQRLTRSHAEVMRRFGYL